LSYLPAAPGLGEADPPSDLGPTASHEPERTCVACRVRRAQSALLRFRRRKDGVIVPSSLYSMGRSAYLCPTRECYDTAIRRQGLRKALAAAGVALHHPEDLWSAVLETVDEEVGRLQAGGSIGARTAKRLESLRPLRAHLATRKEGA
jgi:hypothetical protein